MRYPILGISITALVISGFTLTQSPVLSQTLKVAETSSPLVPLKDYWNGEIKDNYPLALQESEDIVTKLRPPFYTKVRVEGCIYSLNKPTSKRNRQYHHDKT